MTEALHQLSTQAHPGFPATIFYAFKQSETKGNTGTASTGWETFLDAVIRSGFAITGTWPMRTENTTRLVGMGTNALASSIVLVCRRRPAEAAAATRREFLTALRTELPQALRLLQSGNVAPVDLAQAAIGPGMGVYTRYARSFWMVSRGTGALTNGRRAHRFHRVRRLSCAARFQFPCGLSRLPLRPRPGGCSRLRACRLSSSPLRLRAAPRARRPRPGPAAGSYDIVDAVAVEQPHTSSR